MKKKIEATIIADSISPQGKRITTYLLTYPRFIHAELMTHRLFSRNSASSRAIPFEKMLKMVEEDPFIPIAWQFDHKGMQGTEYFTNERISNYSEYLDGNEVVYQLEEEWLEARNCAIEQAKNMNQLGLTKQLCNRLLEPFMWHTVLVTATEWENFFALRAHEAAEIHIQELAYKMLDAYNKSEPNKLKYNEWHIPFGDKIDEIRLKDDLDKISYVPNNIINGLDFLTHAKIEIATARCARVSYYNFDGTDDYLKDIELYKKLSSIGHWSPFEHCAKAVDNTIFTGNFNGWLQIRHTFTNENKKDNRVIKK